MNSSPLSTLLLPGFHHPTMYIYPLYIYRMEFAFTPMTSIQICIRMQSIAFIIIREVRKRNQAAYLALNNFHNLFKLFFFLTSSFFLSRAGLTELISPSPFFGYTLEGLKTCESTMLCPPSMFPSPLCNILPG